MTAKTKRRKKMTVAEKAYRANLKKQMQANGTLPPDKKPLNRKKFAIEVLQEYEATGGGFYEMWPYLATAIAVTTPFVDEGKITRTVTPEQVGVLKTIKIALEIAKFSQQVKAEGRTSTTTGEMFDAAIKPILDL